MQRKRAFLDPNIEKMRLPKEREKYITEGNGLYLKLTPTGKKTWFHYGATRKWLRLGDFPSTKVAEARTKNEQYKEITDQGLDPTEERIKVDYTVKELYDKWYEEGSDKNGKPWSELYKRNVRHIFNADILPYIGKLHIAKVRKAHVNQLLQKILDRDSNSHCRQVYMRLQRFFNYAAERDLIEFSPMTTIPTKGVQNQRDRVLTKDEIKTFMTEIRTTKMNEDMASILMLILRTGQRPSECSGIHENEIEDNWWTIPGTRTKNGLAHRVYLTDSVIELLGHPCDNGYYFESHTEKPYHRNAIAKALRLALKDIKEEQEESSPTLDIEPFTAHDLRRTCATNLAEMNFTDDVIGAILNHKKRSVTGIYNRHQYDTEKQRAMLAWDRKLNRVVSGDAKGKVVNIK